jgi:hypothetical protein
MFASFPCVFHTGLIGTGTLPEGFPMGKAMLPTVIRDVLAVAGMQLLSHLQTRLGSSSPFTWSQA